MIKNLILSPFQIPNRAIEAVPAQVELLDAAEAGEG
jgi:hypothetical protein